MPRRLIVLVALSAACRAPTSPPPTPAAPTPAAAPVSAVQAPLSPSPLGFPTAVPSVVRPTEPPADAPLDATATPPPATPTAIAGERLAPPEETQALAGAAPSAAEPGGPAPVVVPPSARLVRGLTPTPDVLASSPMLAPGAVAVGSVDYPGAIKRVQDARKAPTAPRLEDRIQAALDRARAAGSEIEVVGWQAALKGSTEMYQVTFMLRENRQGLQAVWEVNTSTGEVRPVTPLAEALDAS